MNENLAVFEKFKIRRVFDEEKQVWYFSVVDIIQALIDQTDFQISRKYWNKLAERLRKEGNQSVSNCHRLKLVAEDGKMRETDVADPETILRIVQSVPSPKAEPIKLWLAKVGYERMKEIADPELSLNRARENWLNLGRSEKWVQQRILSQETRNKLTDFWKDHEIKEGEEYAILTNIIHQEWSGLSVREYKNLKGLKNENLRDNMSEAELIFTALAELSTRQIAEVTDATGLPENKEASRQGGRISKKARLELESKTGKSIVTSDSYLPDNDKKKLKSKNK